MVHLAAALVYTVLLDWEGKKLVFLLFFLIILLQGSGIGRIGLD
jgi:hypothetical protein